METKQQINKAELVTSLLKHLIENDENYLSIAERLKTLFFMRDQLNKEVSNDPLNYIGTEEFHKMYATIDSIKVNLISKISNI
jgi:hypothetical protein